MLRIYGRATSSNVQAAMWLTGELGLEVERLDYGHSHGGLDTPEFRALNPNGKIPVLVDGDKPPVWETGAVLRYLAAAYGGPDWWPEAPADRIETDKWAEWAKVNVCIGFTGPIFWQVVRTAPAKRNLAAVARALAVLTGLLRIAEAQLAARPYLAGQRLSLADIQLGHLLYRYFDIEIDRADLPALRAYYDRLTERPAYRTHVMVSYEPLRVTE